MTIGFNNGIYESMEQINIPINSLAINRGYGVFEFLQVINSKPFYIDRHMARLKNSLNQLRISTKYENEVASIINEIIIRNNLVNSYITIFVLPNNETDLSNYEGNLYVFHSDRPKQAAILNEQGANLLLSNYKRDFPLAKSTSYLFGQYMRYECEQNDALDVLYYDGATIQETSRGNIFIVKNGYIYTPSKNVLKGITRSIIIDIIKLNNYLFKEKEIKIQELFAADEVFVTSTTKNVTPIVSIQNKPIADGKPGEITMQLHAEFFKLKNGFA